ncbi:MAG: FtsQ-type POTRA domain-containing protein [Clostridia bacterium]|nr:FtsQ-type POTRA domain-containing protein [Clostridia bacterium]
MGKEKNRTEIVEKNKKINKAVSKKNKGKLKRKILRGLVYLVLIVFALSLFFLLGFGVYKLYTASRYNIGVVNVEGNVKYTIEEIKELANIGIGTNINKLKTNKTEKTLEELPYVRNAKVIRKYPETVIIKIEEYESSFVALNKETDEYIRLTDKGVILEKCKLEDVTEKELLLFGIHFDDNLGEKIVELEQKKLQTLIDMMDKYSKQNISKKITSVEFNEGDIILTLDYDIDVIMDTNEVEYKLDLLRSILDEINGKVGTIDMTIENPIFAESIK